MSGTIQQTPLFDLTIRRDSRSEITIKRSRFLAFLYPVTTKEEAMAHLDASRKEHWDAVHHCYAYRIGTHGLEYRMSDDGEPSGTAGKPILFALQKRRLTNVCLIVVRYFGGTKLGVGPLARAYGEAAASVLDNSELIPIIPTEEMSIHCSFDDVSRVIDLLAEAEATYTPVYSEVVRFDVTLPIHRADFVREELIARTNARAGYSKISTE